MERLDKFLCDSGAGTRSQVKVILKSGRVSVDGRPEKDGSRKIDPAVHIVSLDGEILGGKQRVVVMLNKPAGFVTATSDPVERTVMELLPPEMKHLDLKPVGRLDKATEGLLLFTNDGDLLHRLISPKKEVLKVYYVRHEGRAGEADGVPSGQAGAAGQRGKPGNGLRRKVSPGSPDDGIPGYDGYISGAPPGGCAGAGGSGQRHSQRAFGSGSEIPGSGIIGKMPLHSPESAGQKPSSIGILYKKPYRFCNKMSKGTCNVCKSNI